MPRLIYLFLIITSFPLLLSNNATGFEKDSQSTNLPTKSTDKKIQTISQIKNTTKNRIYITTNNVPDEYKILPVLVKYLAKEESPSKLPVPRFVNLKSDDINGRLGPSLEHPIIKEFHKKHSPMLIIQDTHTGWRRVIDNEGYISWMHSSLLSGSKYIGFVPNKETINLYKKPTDASAVIMQLKPDLIGTLIRCSDFYCKIRFELQGRKHKGYVKKKLLWGVKGSFKNYLSQLNEIDELTLFEYE